MDIGRSGSVLWDAAYGVTSSAVLNSLIRCRNVGVNRRDPDSISLEILLTSTQSIAATSAGFGTGEDEIFVAKRAMNLSAAPSFMVVFRINGTGA